MNPLRTGFSRVCMGLVFTVMICTGTVTCGDFEEELGFPEIVYFRANPEAIPPRGTTELSWRIENALDAGIYPMIGPIDPIEGTCWTPATRNATLYTLTATNMKGSVTAQRYIPIEVGP